MYYGTHGPFKRAEAGQAITFENDKVRGEEGRGRGGRTLSDSAGVAGYSPRLHGVRLLFSPSEHQRHTPGHLQTGPGYLEKTL